MIWGVRIGKDHSQEFADCGYALFAPVTISALRDCSKSKVVVRGDTVVPALPVVGRLHPRQGKTGETKRSLSRNGMNTADAALQTLRADVIDIVLGSIFLSIGATGCAIAAIRWRKGVGILAWFGVFSGMYGLQKLGQTPTILTVLPHSLQSVAPYVNTAVMYLLLISALFAWRELSLGKLRFLTELEIFAVLAIALAGMGTFLLGGPANQWMFYNNLLAVLAMLVLLAVVLVPKLASQFLVISNHRILTAGMLIFALEVLYTNLGTVLHYDVLPLVDSLGFAVLLFSLGYVALEIVFKNERRSAFHRDGT